MGLPGVSLRHYVSYITVCVLFPKYKYYFIFMFPFFSSFPLLIEYNKVKHYSSFKEKRLKSILLKINSEYALSCPANAIYCPLYIKPCVVMHVFVYIVVHSL